MPSWQCMLCSFSFPALQTSQGDSEDLLLKSVFCTQSPTLCFPWAPALLGGRKFKRGLRAPKACLRDPKLPRQRPTGGHTAMAPTRPVPVPLLPT